MEDKVNSLFTNKKTIFLALDQGLEHGPKDFNTTTINPEYIFNLTKNNDFNALILQKGLAMKYRENYSYKTPLIVKLNGKTKLGNNSDPYSPQICSVAKAVKLGANAIGYTIYYGSIHEGKMFKEFASIEEEAHEHGLPVILWAYPRGNGVTELSTETLAYAARASLELGADIIKLRYNNDAQGFNWVVKSAGSAKVVVAGGEKTEPENLLKEVYDQIKAGASGVAIGRNVWQADKPLAITKAIKAIVFENKKPDQALKLIR